jgi:hypothetical protein
MDDQPNWFILLLLGTVAWPVLLVGWRLLVLLYRRARPSDLCGTWFEYNLSRRDGDFIVVEETWRVRPSLLHQLAFHAVGDGYSYGGHLTPEKHHLLAQYTGKKHEESVYCRFEQPATSGGQELLGLWVGVDFDNQLVAGPQLLSRVRLSGDEPRVRLHRMARTSDAAPVLGVRRPRRAAVPKPSTP